MCKRCGKETAVIGYEESSQLDVEPAKYFVLVTKRAKRACRSMRRLVELWAVSTAPKVPGSRASWKLSVGLVPSASVSWVSRYDAIRTLSSCGLSFRNRRSKSSPSLG